MLIATRRAQGVLNFEFLAETLTNILVEPMLDGKIDGQFEPSLSWV